MPHTQPSVRSYSLSGAPQLFLRLNDRFTASSPTGPQGTGDRCSSSPEQQRGARPSAPRGFSRRLRLTPVEEPNVGRSRYSRHGVLGPPRGPTNKPPRDKGQITFPLSPAKGPITFPPTWRPQANPVDHPISPDTSHPQPTFGYPTGVDKGGRCSVHRRRRSAAAPRRRRSAVGARSSCLLRLILLLLISIFLLFLRPLLLGDAPLAIAVSSEPRLLALEPRVLGQEFLKLRGLPRPLVRAQRVGYLIFALFAAGGASPLASDTMFMVPTRMS